LADLDASRVDPQVLRVGRRNETALLLAARQVNHTLAAQRLGISKQTQSDWIREHLSRAAAVCAAYNIKWVNASEETVPLADMTAMLRFAEIGLESLKRRSPALVEDDIPTIPGDL
jgi:hypothetical protein